MQPNEDQELF